MHQLATVPSHMIVCPLCAKRFDLFAASWCIHVEWAASKVCPHCRRCLCQHPAYQEPHFWKEAPLSFKGMSRSLLILRG